MSPGRPRGNYTQAQRLFAIAELLRHRGSVTIPGLMAEFGVNRRTIQRDIGLLHEQYAIEEGEKTEANEKTFRLKPSGRVEALSMTLTEMIALYMGRNLFAFTAGTDLKDAMDSLYEKLRVRLNARNAKVKSSLPKKFYCTGGFPKSYHARDDVLNHVLTGLIEEKKVAVTYKPPRKRPYEDVIHPYTLVVHNHALYVHGHSERAAGERTLAIERIVASQWRGVGSFDYPTEYSPEAVFADSFGISRDGTKSKVQLVFAPTAAAYVTSRQWHPSMKIKRQREGDAVEVTMEVFIGEELIHWITGYGPSVRVLAPQSLRDAVQKRHAESVGAHA